MFAGQMSPNPSPLLGKRFQVQKLLKRSPGPSLSSMWCMLRERGVETIRCLWWITIITIIVFRFLCVCLHFLHVTTFCALLENLVSEPSFSSLRESDLSIVLVI
ncbi:hypothetical protein XELAEV_18002197mg [Xenopus laevis]|nr:hypothetical protein XELAEV_18002197mg [Xenopus laevis]